MTASVERPGHRRGFFLGDGVREEHGGFAKTELACVGVVAVLIEGNARSVEGDLVRAAGEVKEVPADFREAWGVEVIPCWVGTAVVICIPV